MIDEIENPDDPKEEEEGTEDLKESDAKYILVPFIAAIIAIILVVFAIFKLAPMVLDTLDKKPSAEEVICPDIEDLETFECPVVDAEACPIYEPCPDCADCAEWVPHVNQSLELPEYLALADDIISRSNQTMGKIDVLVDLYYDAGDAAWEQKQVLNNKEWMSIRDDVGQDVYHIYEDLIDSWPPGPYNSGNPLLDSHARLLTATSMLVKLDSALTSLELEPSAFPMRYINNNAHRVLDQLGYAQTGLNMVR